MNKLFLTCGTANVTAAAALLLSGAALRPHVVCAALAGLCFLAVGLLRK